MVKFIKKGFEGSVRHKKRRARVKGSAVLADGLEEVPTGGRDSSPSYTVIGRRLSNKE
jgi:hypothetical protein